MVMFLLPGCCHFDTVDYNTLLPRYSFLFTRMVTHQSEHFSSTALMLTLESTIKEL